MTLSADLRRWAIFAVWEDERGARRVPRAARGRRALARARGGALCRRLAPLRAHGAWGGANPLGGAGRGHARRDEPVAILTRATSAARSLRAFYGAIEPPAADLAGQPGLLASVGVGEWPIARQATFSLWRSFDDARAYAYGRPDHREVVRRTRAERGTPRSCSRASPPRVVGDLERPRPAGLDSSGRTSTAAG